MLSVFRSVFQKSLAKSYKTQRLCTRILPGYTNAKFATAVTSVQPKTFQEEKSATVDLAKISFHDAEGIFSKVKTSELIAAGLKLSSMRMTFIFQNAGFFLNLGVKFFGRTFVFGLVRHTLFKQFAGGETFDDLMKTGSFLWSRGIGTIVDCAVEAEDTDKSGPSNAWMDTNEKLTIDSIHCASALRDSQKTDFAFLAMKVTCLCPPQLLRSITSCMNAMHWLFALGTNVISNPSQVSIYSPKYHDVLLTKVLSKENAIQLLQSLWPETTVDTELIYHEMADLPGGASGNDGVSYIQWTSYFSPEKICSLPSPIISGNQDLSKTLAEKCWLNSKDLEVWELAMKRVTNCFEAAVERKVRLLVDAEQTFYQTAIDWVAIKGSEKYSKLANTNDPSASDAYIYNTHQLYLKNSFGKVKYEAARADLIGYKFASKLVRGAYMIQEVRCAKEKNYDCMVQSSVEDTCNSYNDAMKYMLSNLPKYEFLCASHNADSIKSVAQELGKLSSNDGQKFPVSFAQLFGMCDYVSLQLAKAGARVYKYVPFGSVENVLPYLIRRAEENSSVFGGARKEAKLVWKEVRRRMFGII